MTQTQTSVPLTSLFPEKIIHTETKKPKNNIRHQEHGKLSHVIWTQSLQLFDGIRQYQTGILH